MKRDEPFNSEIKSANPPRDLLFRPVRRSDREAIAMLMAERNPGQEFSEVLKKTDREIALVETDPNYRLFVAETEGRVAGFCRSYHSSSLPESKKIFPAPEGWYGMGILVEPKMRRQGIARFLSENRLTALKEHRASELFSLVDSKNQTSLRMHREFGYEEITRAPGFLHIGFESGEGVLFKILIV